MPSRSSHRSRVFAALNVRRILMVSVVMLLVATTVQAQFERRRAPRVAAPEFSIGVFSGINTNVHTVDFTPSNGGAFICEQFSKGAGAGLAGGLDLMYNFDTHYALEMRLGYGSAYAAFVSDRGQIRLLQDTVTYLREHIWRPVLTYGTAELLFNFSPVQRRVQFLLGPTLSYALGKSFTQEEHIVTADGPPYKFPNGKDTMVVDQGIDLGNVRSIVFGAEIGVLYEWRLSRSLMVCPNAFAHFFLQSPSERLTDWSVLTFKIGATLRYIATFDE